jgi:hypothetical protein
VQWYFNNFTAICRLIVVPNQFGMWLSPPQLAGGAVVLAITGAPSHFLPRLLSLNTF